jgi:CO/xanthine dehydrogenase FAD-binding subunit
MTGTLLTPGTLDDVVVARHEHPRAQVIAGGTDVVADLNRGCPATGLVSLRGVAELHGIRFEDGRWRLGAMSTIADVRANAELAPPNSALGQATRSMGSRQIRNRATVGGNICGGGSQRTLIPILLAYDATVDVVGGQGRRTAALADVLAPQGVQLGADEILTAVSFGPVNGPQRFYRVGPRNAVCYATASVTVVVDESARSVRVALGGVASTAIRAPAAEDLANDGIDWLHRRVDDSLAADFGSAAAAAAQPVSDMWASADYRSHAVSVMARRALKHIFEGERYE